MYMVVCVSYRLPLPLRVIDLSGGVSPCRFLKAAAELGVAVLDAVSWHQYVINPTE